MIEIKLPIRLQTPNIKEHWTKSYKRNKRIAQVIGFSLRTNLEACRLQKYVMTNTKVAPNKKIALKGFKIKVTLVKFGRRFDYDNMVYSFKQIRDTVCQFLLADYKLAPGQADCQEIFDIQYLQEKGGSGIKILLELVEEKGGL